MGRSMALKMQTIQLALGADPPIDQQLLSNLSKCCLRQYLHGQSGSLVSDDIESLWRCLVSSALSQSSTEKYLTATCNCISVFLLSAASSPFDDVRQFPFSRMVWFAGFRCAQRTFDSGKTKPALQVLETLAQLLKEHPDQETATAILGESCQTLLNVLLTGDLPRQVKPACIALTCLVKKTELLVRLENLLAECLKQVSTSWKRYQLQNYVSIVDPQEERSNSRHLFLSLLFAIRNLETRSAALKLFSLLIRVEGWTRDCRPAQSAAAVIELFVEENTVSLGDFAENVLPVILDDEPRFQMFCNLYKPKRGCSESRLILYLSVLQVGRLKKFLSEEELPITLNEVFAPSLAQTRNDCDPYQSFRLLLRSSNSSVRIHAYSLLTATFGTIASIPEGVLGCFLSCLRYIHDDNDAYERGEVLGITRRFLKRLESSRASLRKKKFLHSSVDDVATLNRYDDFIRQFAQFLLQELDPGISYPRHILALHTLQMLLKAVTRTCPDLSSLVESLSSLVLDPFDDVRSLSAQLLGDVSQLRLKGRARLLSPILLRDVEKLSARTCRHDHADAAGRLLAVVARLSSSGGGAQTSSDSLTSITDLAQRLSKHTTSPEFGRPGSEFPLHAILLGLAYSLDLSADAALYSRLVNICQKVWLSVQTQLCVDSPETATEDIEEDNLRGPKDLLAYSWRALRDSNLVLQAIIRGCWHDHNVLSSIGWLCMEQLTLLRHRGAFSAVAQTFSLCCEKARTAWNTATQQLNSAWYKAALEEIDKQSTKLTRRSAGLPAMMCAVLSPTDPEFFTGVYVDLKEKASRPVVLDDGNKTDLGLSQVHALNCLKDIMTNSKLRTTTEQYLGEMLELAADNLSSSTWAIQNCGLMLLRACMNRLNPNGLESPTESLELSSIKGIRKQPTVVAMDLLGSKLHDMNDPMPRSEVVFAGLDLAKHVAAARVDGERLNDLIYQQLGSPIWAIRDHAARLLAAWTILHNIVDDVFWAYLPLAECPDNLLHGNLLLFRYVLEGLRQRADEATAAELLQKTTSLISAIAPRFNDGVSPYTKAAFFDVVNDALLHTLATSISLEWPRATLDLLQALIIQLDEPSNSFYHPRVLMCEILCVLLQTRHSPDQYRPLSEIHINELARDPDATHFIVEQIEDRRIKSLPAFADLLVTNIKAAQAADVRASAMLALAKYLESSTDGLSDQQANSLQEIMGTPGIWDRPLWNASLRLQGSLIRRNLLRQSSGMSDHLMARLRSWLFVVQAASYDELEFSTRLSAAAALRHCAGQMVRRLDQETTPEKEELSIIILSTLYDQLNDDDEEIREVAEKTASTVLHQGEPQSGSSFSVCAFATREFILDLLVDRFSTTSGLPKLSLGRIVGQSQRDLPGLQQSCHTVFQESVTEGLVQIRSSVNDLFAEEKQNLYIDDLDEIDKWTSVLERCGFHDLNLEWREAAIKWVSEGLVALTSLMRSGSEGEEGTLFHPLGPTYNSEVLVLCLRVVKLATALIRLDACDKKSSSIDLGRSGRSDGMRQKMLELRSICLKTGAHRRVIESLDVTPASKSG